MALKDQDVTSLPPAYKTLLAKGKEIGFDMPSDLLVGSLLKTLVSSKLKSNVLELGTGIGLSLSWMVAGLDENSSLMSIDNNPELINIVKEFFKEDKRVNLICQDASIWIKKYRGDKFDLIFADAWPGKYSKLDEVLSLLKKGGFYMIDDMIAQPNWPDGHKDHVNRLINELEERDDLTLTKMNWSTGVIIATKK